MRLVNDSVSGSVEVTLQTIHLRVQVVELVEIVAGKCKLARTIVILETISQTNEDVDVTVQFVAVNLSIIVVIQECVGCLDIEVALLTQTELGHQTYTTTQELLLLCVYSAGGCMVAESLRIFTTNTQQTNQIEAAALFVATEHVGQVEHTVEVAANRIPIVFTSVVGANYVAVITEETLNAGTNRW